MLERFPVDVLAIPFRNNSSTDKATNIAAHIEYEHTKTHEKMHVHYGFWAEIDVPQRADIGPAETKHLVIVGTNFELGTIDDCYTFLMDDKRVHYPDKATPNATCYKTGIRPGEWVARIQLRGDNVHKDLIPIRFELSDVGEMRWLSP